MSGGPDARVAAMTAMLFHASRVQLRDREAQPVATPESATSAQIDEAVAEALLVEIRLVDEAAAIYRVSLDAAIEAAAKHLAEADLGLGSWLEADEEARAYWRRKLRSLITAAVMGGAQ